MKKKYNDFNPCCGHSPAEFYYVDGKHVSCVSCRTIFDNTFPGMRKDAKIYKIDVKGEK